MKRNFKFKMCRVLRNLGLLCKPTLPRRKGLRISRTIMPDGLVIEHNGFVEKAPLNNQSFLSELHIYHEIKNSVKYKKLKK
jgi:hypothetical protein